MLRQQDAQGEGDQQQEHQVVVLQPEPGRDAGAEPPPRPVPQQCRGDAQQGHGPGQQVQRGGVVHVVGPEQDGGACHGERGQHPAEAAGAEQRREPGRQDHDRPAGQRRDDPDRGRAEAGQLRDASEQRRERRLVHVAERQMAARLDEVQLVLHEAVPAADRELDRHEPRRDQPGKQRHPIRGRNASRRGRRDGRDGRPRDRSGGTGGLVHDGASTASPAGKPRHEIKLTRNPG